MGMARTSRPRRNLGLGLLPAAAGASFCLSSCCIPASWSYIWSHMPVSFFQSLSILWCDRNPAAAHHGEPATGSARTLGKSAGLAAIGGGDVANMMRGDGGRIGGGLMKGAFTPDGDEEAGLGGGGMGGWGGFAGLLDAAELGENIGDGAVSRWGDGSAPEEVKAGMGGQVAGWGDGASADEGPVFGGGRMAVSKHAESDSDSGAIFRCGTCVATLFLACFSLCGLFVLCKGPS